MRAHGLGGAADAEGALHQGGDPVAVELKEAQGFIGQAAHVGNQVRRGHAVQQPQPITPDQHFGRQRPAAVGVVPQRRVACNFGQITHLALRVKVKTRVDWRGKRFNAGRHRHGVQVLLAQPFGAGAVHGLGKAARLAGDVGHAYRHQAGVQRGTLQRHGGLQDIAVFPLRQSGGHRGVLQHQQSADLPCRCITRIHQTRARVVAQQFIGRMHRLAPLHHPRCGVVWRQSARQQRPAIPGDGAIGGAGVVVLGGIAHGKSLGHAGLAFGVDRRGSGHLQRPHRQGFNALDERALRVVRREAPTRQRDQAHAAAAWHAGLARQVSVHAFQ